MTKLKGWKTLKDDGRSELVLAVDFATTGRSDSSFSDLAPRLGGPVAVWETRQPADGANLTAAGYLDLWAAEVTASGREVRAVLGYCAGSMFAGELAARIAERQGSAPALVVFDPEPPTPASLYRDFDAMMNQFASLLSPDEVAAAQAEGTAARDGAHDFATCGAELVRVFGAHAGSAFARAELDADMLDEFTDVFRSFVSYLDAARQLDPAQAWADATAVSSRTPTEGAKLAARVV
ncbi:hypothetical protein, partial [Amycolatopsis sp. H20-H5]|uniref:hypothetical protein n=1 Tax=Amycolatopsis sp. H20-H5 TaxID=3046309 RepID=UPI002DB8FDA4